MRSKRYLHGKKENNFTQHTKINFRYIVDLNVQGTSTTLPEITKRMSSKSYSSERFSSIRHTKKHKTLKERMNHKIILKLRTLVHKRPQ